MRDLYKRLRGIGFDEDFLMDRVLPDWWEDSLGGIPNNRALAEAAIARVLALPVSVLRDPSATLQLPPLSQFRLKRNRGTDPAELLPAIHVAFRAAHALEGVLINVSEFSGPMLPAAARADILSARSYVDLQSLVDFAWRSGIVVLHLSALPKHSKKFSGIASFCDGRPTIILATARDSAPWIAFHLAHELGHILLGHVTKDSPALIDTDIESVDRTEQEVQADEFACELLTGIQRPAARPVYGWTAQILARRAMLAAASVHVDPGIYALFYGKGADRMAVAQNALKVMGLHRGGQRIVYKALQRHLQPELPETTERFLGITAA